MALIEWSPALSVGVGEIDAQHKVLVDMINRLNDAMKIGQGKAALEKILNEMVSYTANHFSTEECYMTSFSYSGIALHKQEHQAFVDQALKLVKDFASGKVTITLEVMQFLKTWLTKHIQGTDKLYTKCFIDGGLKP